METKGEDAGVYEKAAALQPDMLEAHDAIMALKSFSEVRVDGMETKGEDAGLGLGMVGTRVEVRDDEDNENEWQQGIVESATREAGSRHSDFNHDENVEEYQQRIPRASPLKSNRKQHKQQNKTSGTTSQGKLSLTMKNVMATAESVRDHIVAEIDRADEEYEELEHDCDGVNAESSVVFSECITSAAEILAIDQNRANEKVEQIAAAKEVALEGLRLLSGWRSGLRYLSDANLWALSGTLICSIGDIDRSHRQKAIDVWKLLFEVHGLRRVHAILGAAFSHANLRVC